MTARPRLRVVVDGSNFATEGRTTPSLAQLDEAVRAFVEENPTAEVIVVADASFEHRVAPGERARFKEAELEGEIVTPPAGAVGRGDAFILKIADRIGAVVLSNDSFQEFHDQYPWLFETGRLIGGKPVPGVGWIFTPRLPVRGAKSVRATKKLSVALPGGVQPTIGTTLTPVKATRTPAKRTPAKESVVDQESEAPKASAMGIAKEPRRGSTPRVAKSPARVAKAPTKEAAKEATRETAKDGGDQPSPTRTPKAAPTAAKKAAKAVKSIDAPKKAAKATKAPAAQKKAVATAPRTRTPAKKSSHVALAPEHPTVEPAVALRRGRQPVNPEEAFTLFRASYRIGARVEGDVSTFTSHGAVIRVTLKNGQHVECYAPTASLGNPAPARARDVLARGDLRTFRLVTVDIERRIAELALP